MRGRTIALLGAALIACRDPSPGPELDFAKLSLDARLARLGYLAYLAADDWRERALFQAAIMVRDGAPPTDLIVDIDGVATTFTAVVQEETTVALVALGLGIDTTRTVVAWHGDSARRVIHITQRTFDDNPGADVELTYSEWSDGTSTWFWSADLRYDGVPGTRPAEVQLLSSGACSGPSGHVLEACPAASFGVAAETLVPKYDVPRARADSATTRTLRISTISIPGIITRY